MDATEHIPTQPPLIYVVDDEPMLLELIAAILEPKGYRVRCFSDALNALQHYSEADPKPDLVITDFSMPDLIGSDLISKCREQNAAQKVLMISGTVEGGDIPSVGQPDCFLPKPYRYQELTEVVERMVPMPV
mgnify:CR=1 FL=1